MEFNKEDLINAKERFTSHRSFIAIPKEDPVISKIVGKRVLAQDPRLLNLIIKYKNGKSPDSMVPDNFLDNPKFIEELKSINW